MQQFNKALVRTLITLRFTRAAQLQRKMTMEDYESAIVDLKEFNNIVDRILGVYLDSNLGFALGKKHIENAQRAVVSQNQHDPDLSSFEYLDNSEMIHGEGDPNNPDSEILHRTTQREFKERNTENGINFKFNANMCLIALYQYWEDHYRSSIATHLGIEKNKLISPILGDIRHIRRSIIHRQSRCVQDVEKCVYINWFKENDEVAFTKEQFMHILTLVKKYINSLIDEYSK
ncbi:MAG: hypothetical protein ACFE95_20500 [Candidatus Hodarchaeota archaeon]